MAQNNLLAMGGMGQPMSMAEAAVADQAIKDQQRAERLGQVMPAIMAQIDPADPLGSAKRLGGMGLDGKSIEMAINFALKLAEAQQNQKALQLQQDAYGRAASLLGGGATAQGESAAPASNGTNIMQAGALMDAAGLEGGSGLMQYGKTQLDQANRAEDIERKERERIEDMERKRTENRVQGYSIAPDAQPTADDAKSLKRVLQARRNLQRLTSKMTDIVKDKGLAVAGPAADRLNQYYEMAKIQIKNLEELGAIQAPDVPIIEGMIPNPAADKELVTAMAGIDARASVLDRLNEFDSELDVRADEAASIYGFVPKGVKKSESQQETYQTGVKVIQTQQEYLALPKGTRYTAPDGTVRVKR